MVNMVGYRRPTLKRYAPMNKRQHPRAYLIAGGIAIAYSAIVYLGCHGWSLDFMGCTDSLHPFNFILYAPAGLALTAVSLITFYNNKEPRKTTLTHTGIVVTVAILISFAMSQIASVTHDTAILCLTLVTVWFSLSITMSLRRALLGWAIITAFLAAVLIFVFPDHQVLASLLCVLFSGGVALYATGASKLAEYSGYAVCMAILALVGIMAYTAVAELGILPPGYEVLLALESLNRAAPYANGIMIITSGFLGFVPFVSLFTKNT